MGFLTDWWQSLGARRAQQNANAQMGAQTAKDAGSLSKGLGEAFSGGPASYLQKQSLAVEGQAQREAKTSADLATKQAVRGAKTAGMMGGQAALAAARQSGDAYNQALTSGRQSLRDQYTQGIGLQVGAMQGMGGIATSAESNRLTQRGQNMDLLSKGIGSVTELAKTAGAGASAGAGAGAGAAAAASDKRVKEDVRPASFSASLLKVQPYAYRYKGSEAPQTGVMAQDLEKGAMAPSVFEGPGGVKMVDGSKLALQNTGALSEHERRRKAIEQIVSSIASRGGSNGRS